MQFSRHAKGATYARWSLLFLLEANFLELRAYELLRITLPRTPVNKALRYCLGRYERADCDLALEDAMLEMFRGGALAAATLTTGLMAGLYHAYAYSVML